MEDLSSCEPSGPNAAFIAPSGTPPLGNTDKQNSTGITSHGSPKQQQQTSGNAAVAGGPPVTATGVEEVRAKDVNPYGHTLVEFEIELNNITTSEETQEVQILQLYEDKFSKAPEGELLNQEEYVIMHHYWKMLESKMIPKSSITLKRDRIEDLAGRYAGFELSSIGTEEEITSEDRDFIDNSNMNDLYIPACMHPPHGGFYVNDEPLYFDMNDEQDMDFEDAAISSQDEEGVSGMDKKHRKRKRKELSEIVVSKKQTMDTGSTTTIAQPNDANEPMPAPQEFIYLDWTEQQLKSLKRSLRKLKNDYAHVQSVFYPKKTVDEMKKAISAYTKKKRAEAEQHRQANAALGKTVNSETLASTVSSQHSGSVTIMSQTTEDEAEEEAGDESAVDEDIDEDLTSHSELRHQESAEDSCSLASLMRSQAGSRSSISSTAHRENQIAKAAKDNKCEALCDEENMPLSRIKESEFEEYMKLIPGLTRRKIKIFLQAIAKCEKDVEKEAVVVKKNVQVLLPHILALQYSRKVKGKCELLVSSQLENENSRELFKSLVSSCRSNVIVTHRDLVKILESVIARDIKLQQKHYEQKVKMLAEKNASYAEAVANNELPQKKFTYSKKFKDAFKVLLDHYLKMYFVESITGKRDLVLKRFFSRKLLPLWTNRQTVPAVGPSSNAAGNISDVSSVDGMDNEVKVKRNDWGVTTESLLQVARIILGLQDAKGNANVAKSVVSTGARSADSKPKDTSSAVQSKNNATKKTDGFVLRENQATNSSKPPKAAATQSKEGEQSLPKSTVVKPKSNVVSDSKANQSSANESIFDSSNEDLDHVSLASLISFTAGAGKSNTNNASAGKHAMPQMACSSKHIAVNPVSTQKPSNAVVTNNAKSNQNKKKTVPPPRNSQTNQYPNSGHVAETEGALGNYERIAKHVSQSPPRSVPHTVDLDCHERQTQRTSLDNSHHMLNGNVAVANGSAKKELQVNRVSNHSSTPQSSNRAQKRRSSVKNSPQVETAAASPRNRSPVARGSIRSPPMMAGGDVAGVNRNEKNETTTPNKHHFVVSSPPAKNPCIENVSTAPSNVLPSPTMDIQQILNQIKMMQNIGRDVIPTEQITMQRPIAQGSVNHHSNGVHQNADNNLRVPTSPVHVDVNSQNHRGPQVHVHGQPLNATNQSNTRHPRIKTEVQQPQSVVSGSCVSLPTFEQLVSPQQYHSPPFLNNNNTGQSYSHHMNGSNHHISPKQRTLQVQESHASPSNEQNQARNQLATNAACSNFTSPESHKKLSLTGFMFPQKTSPALVSPVNSQVPSVVNQNISPQFQNQQRQPIEAGFNLNSTSPVVNGRYLNQMLDGTNLTPLQYPAAIMGTNSLLQVGSGINPALAHISHQQVQNHVQFRPNFSFGSPEK